MPPIPLNKISGMPQIGAAFAGWMTSINLVIVTDEVIDGFVVQKQTPISFNGVVQPLSAEKLELKPEGERSWEWLQIHCFSGVQNLQTNDKILYNGLPFKVMQRLDYSLNNYIEYHIVADYFNG